MVPRRTPQMVGRVEPDPEAMSDASAEVFCEVPIRVAG